MKRRYWMGLHHIYFNAIFFKIGFHVLRFYARTEHTLLRWELPIFSNRPQSSFIQAVSFIWGMLPLRWKWLSIAVCRGCLQKSYHIRQIDKKNMSTLYITTECKHLLGLVFKSLLIFFVLPIQMVCCLLGHLSTPLELHDLAGMTEYDRKARSRLKICNELMHKFCIRRDQFKHIFTSN